MKYFATSKAKLRGWWCLSGFVGPYKIVKEETADIPATMGPAWASLFIIPLKME